MLLNILIHDKYWLYNEYVPLCKKADVYEVGTACVCCTSKCRWPGCDHLYEMDVTICMGLVYVLES